MVCGVTYGIRDIPAKSFKTFINFVTLFQQELTFRLQVPAVPAVQEINAGDKKNLNQHGKEKNKKGGEESFSQTRCTQTG
jgi:hypothetical protein